MSCCPPDSWPALDAGYAPLGTTIDVATSGGGGDAGGDAATMKVYVSGDSKAAKRALVVLPDIFGIDSGRTKAMADHFAARGFYVLVPDVLLADAMDPATYTEHLAAWAPRHSYAKHVRALLVDGVLPHLREHGFGQFAALGFCYGSWLIARMAGDDEAVAAGGAGGAPNSIRAALAAGVCAHPSVPLEGFHGREPEALGDTINAPLLFLTCNNDHACTKADGAIATRCKKRDVTLDVVEVDHAHGYLNRGDVADAAVKAAVKDGLERALAFFDKHYATA